MNIWIGLPAGVDAVSLRGLAQQAGIDYLPGRYFSVSRPQDSGLRLSFAGLEPDQIRDGIGILGSLIQRASNTHSANSRLPALAMV
jgi:2-aminoadipate transaminase